jgi:hypothetical protein
VRNGVALASNDARRGESSLAPFHDKWPKTDRRMENPLRTGIFYSAHAVYWLKQLG